MSRLKRKLETAFDGALPAAARLTENFCLIGTPLPSLDKAKDNNEFVPVWKQDVRDEQGRRRLHGAFTGGFSAGYYNTVGSKEGWTPSKFTSSRGERAASKQARPEDFMDDEDRAEQRDAQKLVDTTDEMDLLGGTEAELARRTADAPPDAVASALAALLPASRDSIGAGILKKMGWRPGQGVGPRITWAQLRAQDGLAAAEPDPEAEKHLYAPRDTKPPVYARKTNTQGVGYVPGATLAEENAPKQDGPVLSTGFGLGALNDAEDDDMDIYESGGRSGARLAYDARDAEDDEGPVLLGPRKPQVARALASVAAAVPRTSTVVNFSNGQQVLAGFVLSETKLADDQWFAPPVIPPGWKPDPRRAWVVEGASEGAVPESAAAPPSVPGRAEGWRNAISAEARGALLGEAPLPAAPRSVFDYLSPKDRARLQALASGKGIAVPAAAPVPPPPPPAAVYLDAATARAALAGFQPFSTDPAKHARYTAYLQAQAAPSNVPSLPTPEHAEFAGAARIFRPVSGAMAARFTSSSAPTLEGGQPALVGLHRPAPAAPPPPPPTEDENALVRLTDPPKVQAARAGMFGPLTREAVLWAPARLLCKRFGVRDPHPAEDPAAPTTTPTRPSAQWDAATAGLAAVGVPAPPPASPPPPADQGEHPDLAHVGLGDADTRQGADTLTYERPAMDIFKAIFASDDEESADEADAAPLDATPAPVLAPAPAPAEDDGPVDMATFRPKFVARRPTGTAPNSNGQPKEREAVRKSKKTKAAKGRATLVSFEVDEAEGPAPPPPAAAERARKKKRKAAPALPVADDDDMWEEAAPAVVQELASNEAPTVVHRRTLRAGGSVQ